MFTFTYVLLKKIEQHLDITKSNISKLYLLKWFWLELVSYLAIIKHRSDVIVVIDHPVAYVFIKCCTDEHVSHILHIRYIPIANVIIITYQIFLI